MHKNLLITLMYVTFLFSAFGNLDKCVSNNNAFNPNRDLLTGIEPDDKIKHSTLEYKGPSGAATSFPWDYDDDFLKMKEKYNTSILMAGYKTYLKDPMPGEEENVYIAANILKGAIVKPGEIFSQNNTIGPYTKDKGFMEGPTYFGSDLITTVGGGVCKIATGLYNTAILCNLPIIERSAHSLPVTYVPYGQDATVAYGIRDFRFKNSTDHTILIWAEALQNTLYIGFYGTSYPPRVEWHHEVLSIKKASVINEVDASLPAGSKTLVLEGMDGGVIKSWITIQNTDGTLTTKMLGFSSYMPIPYIYKVGR